MSIVVISCYLISTIFSVSKRSFQWPSFPGIRQNPDIGGILKKDLTNMRRDIYYNK